MPAETGVNSQAPEFDKYTYESVDNPVAMIKPGDFLAKVDINDAKLPFGAKASLTNLSQDITGCETHDAATWVRLDRRVSGRLPHNR